MQNLYFHEYVLIPIENDEWHDCIINLRILGVFMCMCLFTTCNNMRN